MIKRICCLLFGWLGLTACASVDVAKYRAEQPALDLRSYFNGTLDAWGMFQDRSGEVVKRFHVVIDASWQGETGTLDERFTYSDGTTQRRVWTLTRQPDGRYIGKADDVVGEAVGEVAGNALRWRYVLALPVDGKVVVSRTRDGGQTFEVLRRGLPQEHAYDLVYRHALAVDGTGERVAIGSTTGGVWASADGGDSWEPAAGRLPPVHAVCFA